MPGGDFKIRLRYTLKSGRVSGRTCWHSQLASAVKRNEDKGITDTTWRPTRDADGDWRPVPASAQKR